MGAASRGACRIKPNLRVLGVNKGINGDEAPRLRHSRFVVVGRDGAAGAACARGGDEPGLH
jgi:hypothetical protein